MEALNKSILDFSAPAPGKAWFPGAHKISGLEPLILAVRPCTAGNAEHFSVSLSKNHFTKRSISRDRRAEYGGMTQRVKLIPLTWRSTARSLENAWKP